MIGVAICIVISLLAWYAHTLREPYRLVSQIHASIRSLASKCPPDFTQDQWNVAVHWTDNLPGNCLLSGLVNLDDLRRFQRELEERAKGKVDMDLIFWIWDEVAKISPGPASQLYTQQSRKVMLDKMQPSSAKSYYWAGDPILGERHDLVLQFYATIYSLHSKRPPDVTHEQWMVAINRTCLLPSDYLLSGQVSLDDLRRFQHELEERAKGKVDMNLIFWIWDEYAKLSPAAQQYKEQFQQVMLDQMQGKWGNEKGIRNEKGMNPIILREQ